MKILITTYKIQDLGGIINYNETLAKGFKDLGHEVDAMVLKNKGKTGPGRVKDESAHAHNGWEWGTGLNCWMHQKSGWEGLDELNYSEDISAWKRLVKNYDLIVHSISVPTATKQTVDDSAWIEVYDHLTPQICVIHDGNMPKLYPHLHFMKEKLMGLACVHDAAFNSCSVLDIPRRLIANPHNLTSNEIYPPWERTNSVVSVQTFKRCKRADKFVRMVPHLYDGNSAILCGTGIEYHYMVSKEKVKMDYLEKDGSRIWENAVESGMDYRGVVNSGNRDRIFSQSKLFVDFSYSKSHNSHGSVFNRTMIEAMIQGCVPVMSDLTMQDNSLFKEGVNYISIPFDADPKDHAKLVDEAMRDEERLYLIQENNIRTVERFERSIIAQEIIELGFGQLKTTIGKPTKEFIANAERKLSHFIGA
ncbi:MAG: hypothetical protein K0U20_09585 [Proteobacteria bacterium]|nr:hypothetical protein [Pseudomonadota bacterium]MCH9735835.1 hypothetical protein [Actinomycetes bacterium]